MEYDVDKHNIFVFVVLKNYDMKRPIKQFFCSYIKTVIIILLTILKYSTSA